MEAADTNIEIRWVIYAPGKVFFSAWECASTCLSCVSISISLQHYHNSISSLFNMAFFLLVHYAPVFAQ